jgi:hypothetical protein
MAEVLLLHHAQGPGLDEGTGVQAAAPLARRVLDFLATR